MSRSWPRLRGRAVLNLIRGPLMSDGPVRAGDAAFQDATWRIQRIAWVLCLGILLLALAGVLGGSGPLSRAQVFEAPGLLVRAPVLMRRGHEVDLEIVLRGLDESPAVIEIGPDFADRFKLSAVLPVPVAVQQSADATRFTLPPHTGTEATVLLRIAPVLAGHRTLRIRGRGDALEVGHFVWP